MNLANWPASSQAPWTQGSLSIVVYNLQAFFRIYSGKQFALESPVLGGSAFFHLLSWWEYLTKSPLRSSPHLNVYYWHTNVSQWKFEFWGVSACTGQGDLVRAWWYLSVNAAPLVDGCAVDTCFTFIQEKALWSFNSFRGNLDILCNLTTLSLSPHDILWVHSYCPVIRIRKVPHSSPWEETFVKRILNLILVLLDTYALLLYLSSKWWISHLSEETDFL